MKCYHKYHPVLDFSHQLPAVSPKYLLFFSGRSENIWVVIEACFILFFVVFNCVITVFTASREKLEFHRILKEVLKDMSSKLPYCVRQLKLILHWATIFFLAALVESFGNHSRKKEQLLEKRNCSRIFSLCFLSLKV